MGLLAAYNDLGLTEALQYFLPKYWIEKKYDQYKTIWIMTFAMQFISGLIIGGALWFGSDWLSVYYFKSPVTEHILKVFSIYFVAINFFQAFSSVYTAFQDVVYDKTIEIARSYSVLACTILFGVFGTISLNTFSYAWLGGLGVGLLLSVFLFSIKYGKTFGLGKTIFDKGLIQTQLRYAFWVFLGMNAGTLLGQVDQQIVVVFLGAAQAGYYSNYLSLFSMYGVVMWPLMALIFPIATELISKKQNDKIVFFIQLLYKYFSVFAISITGLFVALGPIIGATFYGQKFVLSGSLLQYSAPFIVFNILIFINFGFLAGMGKVKERVRILATALVANIAANIVSILFLGWGLYGVIFATVIGWVIMFWKSQNVIRTVYPIHYNRGFVLRNTVLVVVLSVLVRFVRHYIPRDNGTNIIYNFIYLIGIVVIYYCMLAGFNYRSIILLWQELQSL